MSSLGSKDYEETFIGPAATFERKGHTGDCAAMALLDRRLGDGIGSAYHVLTDLCACKYAYINRYMCVCVHRRVYIRM